MYVCIAACIWWGGEARMEEIKGLHLVSMITSYLNHGLVLF